MAKDTVASTSSIVKYGSKSTSNLSLSLRGSQGHRH